MRDAGIIGVYGDQSSSSRQASMPTIDELEKAKSEIESIFDMYVYLIFLISHLGRSVLLLTYYWIWTFRADEIKINVDVAIDILNNLLLYEKHDGGLMELEQQECPGVVLVHDVFKSFAIQARAKYVPSFNFSIYP